jgi:hypothetical protein
MENKQIKDVAFVMLDNNLQVMHHEYGEPDYEKSLKHMLDLQFGNIEVFENEQ